VREERKKEKKKKQEKILYIAKLDIMTREQVWWKVGSVESSIVHNGRI